MPKEETFLRYLSHTPVTSSLELASVAFSNNTKLIVQSTVFYTLLILFLEPLVNILDSYESLYILLFLGLIFIVYTMALVGILVSGIIYFGKLIRGIQDSEELEHAIKSMTFKDFHFKWLRVALGHVFALMLYLGPLFLLLYNSDEVLPLLVISLILVFLFLYTYSLIQERVISANTFKEGFKALFLIFNFSFMRQTLDAKYMWFMFLCSILIGIISKISNIPSNILKAIYSDTSLIYLLIDAISISLYTLFVSIFLTSTISVLSKEIVDSKGQ